MTQFIREAGKGRERVARQVSIVALIVLFLTSLFSVGPCARAEARMQATEARPSVARASRVSRVSRAKAPPASANAVQAHAACAVSKSLSAAKSPRTVAHAAERPVALLPPAQGLPAPVFGTARVLRPDRESVRFPCPRSDGEPGRPREP